MVWPAAAAVVVVALGLRLHQLGEDSFWIDEARAVLRPPGTGLLTHVRDTFGPLEAPLSFLLVAAFRKLPFGLETAARLPFALAGAAEVLGTFLLARTVLRRDREALAAAAFVAVAPFALRYSQEARYYVAFSALHLLSWWAVLESVRGRRWGWWTWTGLLALASLMHPFAPLLLATQVGAVFWLTRRTGEDGDARRAARRRALAGAAVAVAVAVPWLVFEAVEWVPALRDGRGLGFRSMTSPAFDLDLFRRGASWLLTGTTPGTTAATPALATLVVAAPLAASGRTRWLAAGLLAYVVLIAAGIVGFSRLVGTYVAFRRVEFLVPVLLVLVAVAVSAAADRVSTALRRPAAGHAVAAAGAALVLVLGVQGVARHLRSEKTDLHEMADVVRDTPLGTTVVLGRFNEIEETAWDPIMRLYLDAREVRRPVLSLDSLDPARLPPAGEVVWITGAATATPGFDVRPLNRVDRLLPVAGDRSIGTDFVLPLYALTSRYATPRELAAQAEVVAALGFIEPAG